MSLHSYQALLLVDGYNVIGAWSSLKTTRDRHGLDLARKDLVEALINYSAFKDFQTQIVFDAHYQNQPANREVITPYLSVYYTDFCQTADTYIEKTCALHRHQVPVTRLIVATSDRAQRLTAIGYGAECMSSIQLAHDLESVARRSRRKGKPQKKSSGRFLFNSLDPKSQQRLSELRKGWYS